MVRVFKTATSWTCHSPQGRGYYNDLGDAMVAAYEAENRQGNHAHIPELRNLPCYYCRFAKSSQFLGGG